MLHVHLFGGLSIAWDKISLPVIPGAVARSLFSYLVTHRDRPHTRDLLAGTFWPDMPDVSARRRLSQALWQIRRALDPHPVLATEGITVQFNPALPLWLDIEEFTKHSAECASGRTDSLEHCVLCIDLYRGEFLAGYYDDWTVMERDQWRETFLEALERLVEGHKSRSKYEEALRYAKRLASEDPWREEAYREAMRLCHLLGRGAEGLKQYEVCRQVLEEELGVGPSPETEALAAEISARADLPELPVLPTAARPEMVPLLERPDRLPLAGRRRELAELLHHLEAAGGGHGGLILVYGEAGVGKTRLLRELVHNAKWRGIETAWGRCYELAAPPAYQPLVEALRASLPILHESAMEPLWKAELSRLLPEMVAGHEPPPSLPPEEERQRLLEAVARSFLALAATVPHLVLLEDAHWMDPASLEALRYLLPRLAEARMLVIITARTEELAAQPAAALGAMESTRLIRRLDLQRLDEAETEELVQRALDLKHPVPRFSARLFSETEGNAFFLIETLWALVDEGLLVRNAEGRWSIPWDESTTDYDELPLPAGVVQSIERRLDRLPAPVHGLLGLAAVIGRGVNYDLWHFASGRSEEEVLTAGDDLCVKGLLLAADPQIGASADFTFAHDQIRRVTYRRLAAPRRRFYHLRVAEALVQLAADEPGTLAHHWTQAEVWDKAASYHRQAGNQSRAVYGNSEASSHYTQALDALVRQSGPADPLCAFELHLAREEVYALQGERAAQAEDLASLEVLAEELDDGGHQGLARGAEVALRRARYAEAISAYGEASAAGQKAVRLAQSVQEATRGISGSELAQEKATLHQSGRLQPARLQSARLQSAGYLIWGTALWRQGDNLAARVRLEQALALARTWHARDLEADSQRNLGLVCLNEGKYAEAEDYFEQTLRMTSEHGDRQREAVVLNSLGIASSSQGHFTRAKGFYEQSLQISRAIGDRRSESVALNNLGTVLQYQGDFEGASANFEQVLHLFQEVGDRQSEGLALANLGDVADYRGDYETARDRYMESLLIFRAVGDRQTEGWILGNLGNACASLADYRKARAYHEEALDALRQVGDRRGEGFVLANLGLLVHHANEQQLAAEYCQQALEITQEIGDRLNQGYAYTNLGHALVSLDRLDDAATAYQQALALRRELGQDNLAVEPLAGLARVGRLQGNLAQALTHTEQILEYLELNPGLDGTDEPLRVYLSCYHILRDSLDPRASGLLIGAQNLLQELAAKIDDRELRRSFLEHATTQREIVAAYRELGTGLQKDQLAVRLPRRGVPTGRPVLEDEYVSATWTVDSPEDKSIANKVARRQYRLARLLREAEEQDAAPTVDDLAGALEVSPGTVKRDLSALRRAGHEVQTRGSRGG